MKNLLLVLVIGLAAYGGYSMWNNHRETPPPPKIAETTNDHVAPPPKTEPTPAPQPPKAEPKSEPEKPPVEPEAPVPAAPLKRLAPEGVFYAIQAFSATTDDGIRGIRAGTPLKLIKDTGSTLRVTDGTQEFDARREHLTNDLDIAAQATGKQASQQTANAEWHEKQKAVAAMNEQQKAAEAASSLATAQGNIAIQNLRNRDAGLAADYARVQQTISEIRREPTTAVRAQDGSKLSSQSDRIQIKSKSTRRRDELPALEARLSAIKSEQRSIAKQLAAAAN